MYGVVQLSLQYMHTNTAFYMVATQQHIRPSLGHDLRGDSVNFRLLTFAHMASSGSGSAGIF